ncbi:hypothetical protein [Hymenobacter ruricola]|uniref:Cytochrome c domain-containing protein n=1 Tax=Hymenobacter ruricola TaxID=2791023 RepID=A0ABS0I3B9_9BACT|nr:hypothetical protein [Hymenobacter ruricola]MBF9221441.1 hypothetical protein [Hymenobacter ruricola]
MKFPYALLAGLTAGGLLLGSCQHSSTSETAREATGPAPAFNITIAPTPPQDLDPGSDSVKLAEFAWAEFFAVNWQSSYSKDSLRDHPDAAWSYQAPDATLAVWETFGHRAELRPYYGKILSFDRAPHYSYRTSPMPGSPSDTLTLFDNLDENSEIGSCAMFGQVQDSVPNGKSMVLYQAKVNRTEYDFIQKNFGSRKQLMQATANTLTNIRKHNAYYNPDTLNGRYKGGTCDCPPGVLCLPCGGDPAKGGQGVGSIEMKTAWRKLTPADDPARFLTRRVVYYTQQISPDGKDTLKSVYHNAVFALIGMHIIHKTVNYPDFVFATWEHVDVEQEHMGFQLLDTLGYLMGGLHSPYQRLHPITTVANQATAAAHAKLRMLNPKSVLLNYRLVGVQGTPTSNPKTTNYFLANYVVESDSTLANFHGSSIKYPFDGGINTLYLGKRLSAGGCQGCHGVAQLKLGTDFSFLLDNVGKPVRFPDPDMSQYPPRPALAKRGGRTIQFTSSSKALTGKLGRYIRATR